MLENKDGLTPKQLQFASYVEQVYMLTGDFPTYGALKSNLPDTNPQDFKKYWGNKKILKFLKAKGVRVNEIEAGTTEVLSPKQMLLVNLLLDYNDNRPDFKKVQSLGITTAQYQRWKSDPGFQAYYNQRVTKIVGEDIGEVDRALFDAARGGDVGAIKLLKAYTGQYRETSGNAAIDVMFILTKVQEILVTYIKDRNILRQVGMELQALATTSGLSNTGPVQRQIPIPEENLVRVKRRNSPVENDGPDFSLFGGRTIPGEVSE